ncbi:MAG: transporter substrate-binding domain-containing protein, partial [Campylobacter concisus]|nr:transporter substrate-binding domain-containing protein [Campylobacter concisus]
MKKIFALLLTAFVALCANELKFGTAANYPPFEYIDENNKITGFDI